MSNQIWNVASQILLPEIDSLPVNPQLNKQLGYFLLELEFARYNASSETSTSDPFRISMNGASILPTGHRTVYEYYLGHANYKADIIESAKSFILTSDIPSTCKLLQYFLSSPAFLTLGRECTTVLFTRLAPLSGPSDAVRPFLSFLQSRHPQILYKPLFALSASTQISTLTPHLRLVRSLASSLIPRQFWLGADPQMMAIILLGDVSLKQSKGKGKEGERGLVNVKLGRYAVILELIGIFESDGEWGKDGKLRAKGFADGLEGRLGVLLVAEVFPSGGVMLTSNRKRRTACLAGIAPWCVDCSSSCE